MRAITLSLALVLLPATLPAEASAQALADRVARAPEGPVRFSYPAREGVCGNGRNISVHDGRGGRDRDWENDCEPGPVHVLLERQGGEVVEIEARVGGRWSATARGTDLGAVEPQAAADYLLALAGRLPGSVGEDAVFPATIARGVTAWPALLKLARAEDVPQDTRKAATFWLGQAAGEEATKGLDDLATSDTADREVREAAVFALSQRPRDEGVPVLIRLARSDRDPKIRRSALFWLGQSGDPRATALFEELLAK